eukprot:3119972-Prymnesium_polylepis.1
MSSVPLPWCTSKSTTATRRPWRAIACAAPIAIVLSRQKPEPPAIGSKPSTAAWCPGGRTRQNAACGGASSEGGPSASAASTSSMARMTDPAARFAARRLPGESSVMPVGVYVGKRLSITCGESGSGAGSAPVRRRPSSSASTSR